MARLILLLGGARSGKSLLAERWAAARGGPVAYVATGLVPGDPEWEERVRAHRARRPPDWLTVETADPVGALRGMGDRFAVALVDCLTLLLYAWERERGGPLAPEEVEGRARALCAGLRGLGRDALLVSNEVGMGIVPSTPAGRRFRDALGLLNRTVAEQADAVYLVVAGLPWRLKPGGADPRPPWEALPP